MPASPSHGVWLRRREITSIPAACLLLRQRQGESREYFGGMLLQAPGRGPTFLPPCVPQWGWAPRAVQAAGALLVAPWRSPDTLPSCSARSIANPQASDAVLGAVAATLKSYPFNFRGAKILSGEEEGVFGWVTANYLLENFIKVGRGAWHPAGTAVVARLSRSSSHPYTRSCLPCSARVARGMDPAPEEDPGGHGLWGSFHTDHL